MRAECKLYSLLTVLIRACVAQQLVDVFTDLHFSYFSWHEPGIVMGVVFWMHGVISPYGRLQPLECAQWVSCTPCPHCVDARLRCSGPLEVDSSSGPLFVNLTAYCFVTICADGKNAISIQACLDACLSMPNASTFMPLGCAHFTCCHTTFIHAMSS